MKEAISITDLYIEVFGKEPVLTGISFPEYPFDALVKAIETGIPYEEEPVPEGAVA